MFIIYILIFLVTFYLYLFRRNHLNRYTKYNLKSGFVYPLKGFFDTFRRPFYDYERELFSKYGRTYVDYFVSNEGCINTSDPELFKKILIKEFPNFCLRVQPAYIPVYARRSLFFLQDYSDWKRVRAQVSPVFTSQRLKQMYINFDYPIQNCIQTIDQLIDSKQNHNVETKKLFHAFALDIIGNVVFSLKTNSYQNDEFSKQVADLLSVNLGLIVLSFTLPEFICRFFDLSLFNTKPIHHFGKLAINLIEERKKNKNIVYNDFIEILMKSQIDGEVDKSLQIDGHINRQLSTEEIVGQVIVFFLGGSETVSGTLVHCFLELAKNPDIQEKLYQDVIQCYPNEKVDYDDIGKSKYLNCVVSETIRKYPGINRMFRVAMNDFDFGDFKVKKGQTLGLSLLNIHHDPQLWDEPDKFKPERFEDGEKELTNYLYLFGGGPRNCVAERFAFLELKSLIIKLVKKYKVYLNDQTMNYKYKNAVLINMIDDLRLRFEKRN